MMLYDIRYNVSRKNLSVMLANSLCLGFLCAMEIFCEISFAQERGSCEG